MRTAFVAKQQGVALAVITGIVRFLCHAHQATVRVLTLSGRDTFAHNGTPGILAQMNHFCSRVCLLMVIGYCHTIEFCRRIVAGKDARRILPGNGRTSFHLCPRQFTVHPFTMATLRHKVIDTTPALGITGIPVLHGAVFHFCTVVHYNFHNGCVQLVLVTHRSRTPFQIRNVRIIIRHNQGSFELPRIAGIDAEIGGQLHRTAYPLRDIDKRTVGEHRRVQCRKEVVTIRHHRTEIFLYQVGMLAHGLAE